MSLIAYLSIIDSSGKFFETKLSNILDTITRGKYSQKKFEQYECLTTDTLFSKYKKDDYISYEYLQFLVDIANNCANSYKYKDNYSLSQVSLTDEQLASASINFYNLLGNEEIMQAVKKIFEGPQTINITSTERKGNDYFHGRCFYDYTFNQPYCTTIKKETINDSLTFTHELMHGVDFYMNPKLSSKNYYGFHETIPYTIDYLFIDYLEANGINPNDIKILREQKIDYVKSLSFQTIHEITSKLKQKGFDINFTPENLLSVIDENILKQLLEIESCLMAYGFYLQIRENKNLGLDNIVNFMKQNIPKETIPDFSKFGLDNSKLTLISQNLKNPHDFIQEMQQYESQNDIITNNTGKSL